MAVSSSFPAVHNRQRWNRRPVDILCRQEFPSSDPILERMIYNATAMLDARIPCSTSTQGVDDLP
jgi:hypothetical protein